MVADAFGICFLEDFQEKPASRCHNGFRYYLEGQLYLWKDNVSGTKFHPLHFPLQLQGTIS